MFRGIDGGVPILGTGQPGCGVVIAGNVTHVFVFLQIFRGAEYHPQDPAAPAVKAALDALDRTGKQRPVALTEVQGPLPAPIHSFGLKQRSDRFVLRRTIGDRRLRPGVSNLAHQVPHARSGDGIRRPPHQIPQRVSS